MLKAYPKKSGKEPGAYIHWPKGGMLLFLTDATQNSMNVSGKFFETFPCSKRKQMLSRFSCGFFSQSYLQRPIAS